MKTTKIFKVPKQSIDDIEQEYMDTVANIKPIPKCQSQHCYIGDGIPYKFRVQNFDGEGACKFDHVFRSLPDWPETPELVVSVEEVELAGETGIIELGSFYAVAFDDLGWFAGSVEKKVSNSQSVVKFMVRDGKRWKWPLKDDISTVHHNFVLCKVSLEPEGNGSRVRWVIPSELTTKADTLYEPYCKR